MIWNEFNDLLSAGKSFLISSHLSLDGDSVGSQLSFLWYLESLGKRVYLYDKDPVPAKFTFLKNSDRITCAIPQEAFDTLLVLDCSNLRRMGWGETPVTPLQILNIDHHRDNTRFGKLNHIDTSAAATAEIIYGYFSSMGLDYPDYIAESLYVGILTDTGGFRFSNTNSRVLRASADLADRGANCAQIYERVYASHPQRALVLQSRIWSTLAFHLGGKVCSMEMPLSILDEIGAVYSDSEGMADHTITSEGVEVGILAKYTDTESHFSLRSKGRIDVGRIAQKILNGGGHSSAAGCTLYEPYPQSLEHMLAIIKQELH